MPELPEVETVKRYLEDKIIGHKIDKVIMSNKKSLRNVSEKKLKSIEGQKIKSLDRKAKHLIINLESNYLILHLRMEGKLFVFKNENEMNEKTNRFHDVMMIYTNKGIILFQDTRRFATVDMFELELSHEDNPVLNKVGFEPFDINPEDLYNRLSKKKIAIKSALLDQNIISGLGNIYVDEVIHSTKILPTTLSNEITLAQCKTIVNSSIKILTKAIESKGTTIRSYTSSLGVEGSYQNYLNVHQQKVCRKCKTEITKIRVGGRGTYFCSNCQK